MQNHVILDVSLFAEADNVTINIDSFVKLMISYQITIQMTKRDCCQKNIRILWECHFLVHRHIHKSYYIMCTEDNTLIYNTRDVTRFQCRRD